MEKAAWEKEANPQKGGGIQEQKKNSFIDPRLSGSKIFEDISILTFLWSSYKTIFFINLSKNYG